MLSVFNQILIVMTAFDTIYLLTAIAEFSFVESFHLTSEWYDLLFVYFLYPLHNITLCCSIYSHVVLAFERYLAVCHPEMVYSTQTRTPHQRPQAGNGHASGGRRRRRRRNPAYSVVRKKVRTNRSFLFPSSFFIWPLNHILSALACNKYKEGPFMASLISEKTGFSFIRASLNWTNGSVFKRKDYGKPIKRLNRHFLLFMWDGQVPNIKMSSRSGFIRNGT